MKVFIFSSESRPAVPGEVLAGKLLPLDKHPFQSRNLLATPET